MMYRETHRGREGKPRERWETAQTKDPNTNSAPWSPVET